MTNIWREIIKHDYPRQEDLLSLVPNANDLIISKLSLGEIFETDTCNGAKKTRQLLCDLIVDTANLLLQNASESGLLVNNGYCWNHLRNV